MIAIDLDYCNIEVSTINHDLITLHGRQFYNLILGELLNLDKITAVIVVQEGTYIDITELIKGEC